MAYPDFLPRLIHWRDVCVAWICLPSVVATWGHSRPERGLLSELNSFAAESPMRQTKSDRRGLPASESSSCARGRVQSACRRECYRP